MKTCHWITEKGERTFIPGCYGGTAYGPDKCTCKHSPIRKDRLMELEKRIEKLEKVISELKTEKDL